MPEAVMDKVSEQLVESAHKISKAASQFADIIDDGINVAKRAVKHSGDALEEFMDENTQRVKRHPIETIGATLAVGIAVGVLVGFLIKRR